MQAARDLTDVQATHRMCRRTDHDRRSGCAGAVGLTVARARHKRVSTCERSRDGVGFDSLVRLTRMTLGASVARPRGGRGPSAADSRRGCPVRMTLRRPLMSRLELIVALVVLLAGGLPAWTS